MIKELSVIIVNYNGIHYLKPCLDSLYTKLQGIEYEIIIFDNASSDNSIAFLKKNYQNVNIIENKENIGFGMGNNQAVSYANGTHLLLLNNDTILIDPIRPILNLIQNDNKIGFLGIKMLDGKNNYTLSAGVFPNPVNMLRFKKLYIQTKEFQTGIFTQNSYEVDWLSGSFLMVSRENYLKINGFDSRYFMYVEDVDICKEMSQLHLKNIFVSNSSYIHFGGFNESKNHLLINGYKTYINKFHQGFCRHVMLFSLQISTFIKSAKKSFVRN